MPLTVEEITPTGHLQVRSDSDGRSYYAFWRDATGKRCRKLGPAHVRATGRKTPRRAPVYRAGDGPKPTAAHLTPNEAQDRLAEILATAPRTVLATVDRSLRAAGDGMIAERIAEKGLSRGTVPGYEAIFERMYRDLGGDTPVANLTEQQLRGYFTDFVAQVAVGRQTAQELRRRGETVQTIVIERWTAQRAEHVAIEVSSKAEAVREAARVGGKWKHEGRGCYRVTPKGARRPRSVRRSEAMRLQDEGWHIATRETKRWILCRPAEAQTRNKYRDLLSGALDYAKRHGWVEHNVLTDVRRLSRRQDRQRILRRDDFYDRDEVARFLEHVPTNLARSFFLTGFDGGARLPGEAQAIRWSAVDFELDVVHVYDNWVDGEVDPTKTGDAVALPLTPRWRAALWEESQRGYCTAPDDFVHTADELGRPVSEKEMRELFALVSRAAGLKAIPMYNARHSFGTGLARGGVDVRTIQGLMRHHSLSTTMMYMAYSPRADLAIMTTRALEGDSAAASPLPRLAADGAIDVAALLARLDEEIPGRWLRVVESICDELAGSTTTAVPPRLAVA